jgi:phytanoyl-CoA hydroxylase
MDQGDLAARFAKDGYVVVPGFRGADSIAALRARAEAIVDEFDPDAAKTVFSTVEERHQADHYFLSSGDKIRCFFEDGALDQTGALKVAKSKAINKIGHVMHDLDPVFEAFSHGSDLARMAQIAGLERPQVWQSMFIFKQPSIGGEVGWHQDATYLVDDPISVTGFWFALEDADRTNGCLWVQPGGHHTPLRKRFLVSADGISHDVRLDDTPWPQAGAGEAVPVEVKAGTLVMFKGLLPHYSAPNLSSRSRHAYTLHAVDGRSHWHEGNWIKRAMPVRGFV